MATTIKRIVLTGGPCAGKTTALVRVIEHFSKLGFKVFCVPEVPTMITQAGWSYLTDNKDFYYQGERAILELQLDLEDKIQRLAETCVEPCIIVCDRGAMDISAYISPEMWGELCDSVNQTQAMLHARYDAVLHLVTAANGAEEFYTTANNAQRYEKADEAGRQLARELDKKVLLAWSTHPHHRVIDNSFDFESKLQRVVKEISAVLELPQPIQHERKYIVEVTGELPHTIDCQISQTYLTSDPDYEVRLRRRIQNAHTVNIHTTTRRLSPTEQIITERHVEDALCESLMQQADPYRRTIVKSRQSFIYQGQFFELDRYEAPIADLVILETKGTGCHEDVKFPPFLRVIKDITNDTNYYNYNLARVKREG